MSARMKRSCNSRKFDPKDGRVAEHSGSGREYWTFRPNVQILETRRLLSNILWNPVAAPHGGDWDVKTNWEGDKVPGPNDTAEIVGLTGLGRVFLQSSEADSVDGLTTDSSATVEVRSGSLSLGASSHSTFGGSVIIDQYAALEIKGAAQLTVASDASITDNGFLSFDSGDTTKFDTALGASQIIVAGTMTATNDSFGTTSGNSASIQVSQGGQIQATGTTFDINQLSLDNGSHYGSGDLTGDTFNMPISVPYGDVQYLADNVSFEQIEINADTLPDGQTVTLNLVGSNTANLQYVFPGGFTIASGAELSVASAIQVVLTDNQTITDSGTLAFAAGDTVNFDTANGPSQIVVTGTMTTAGDSFSTASGNAGSIHVGPNGRLQASTSDFNLNSLTWDSASVHKSGDLSGDTFNMPINVPYDEVQYLSDNVKFEQIVINSDTLPSDQTLLLNLIGSDTSDLQYVFSGAFTIASGAVVSAGPDVTVLLTAGLTLTDSGTLNFAAGDTVNFDTAAASSQIVVRGLMTAIGASFNTTTGALGAILVSAGGELQASYSTFNLNKLSFDDMSVYMVGDLTGDAFNMPLSVPYGDVQHLADNVKFEQIDINAATLPSNQTLLLNLIGSDTAELQYVFSEGFTIAHGASINVGLDVPVLLTDGQTINDQGTLTFAAGDTMSFSSASGASQIVITGTMTATRDTFTTTSGNLGSIAVQPGGHIMAAATLFDLNQLSIDNASIYGRGDLTGDTFNTPISAPYEDLQYLSDNTAFELIGINADTLPGNQTLTLDLIGNNTANLQYGFLAGFTIASGATLNVASGIPVFLADNQTVTDNGTLNFGLDDTVNFSSGNGASVIAVTGTMTATGDLFNTITGSSGSIQVDSGGLLNLVDSTYNRSTLSYNAGSKGSLNVVTFSGQLDIDGAAAVNISGDDFSNLGNQGIVATGNTSAAINLTYNYWGTTSTSLIHAKILDHYSDPTILPTVNFQPFVSNSAETIASSTTVNDSPADQNIALNAVVTASSGKTVNEGTETFTILNGSQVVGKTTAPATVSNGAVSATYQLPGGTPPGRYMIEAYYSGSRRRLPAGRRFQPVSERDVRARDSTQTRSVSRVADSRRARVHAEPGGR